MVSTWMDFQTVNMLEILTHASVYVLFFCGAPIAWKSKAGKSVTISSTEAEYYATSEIAKDVIFSKNLLEEIRIKIQLPINIKYDNGGAIYLANNHCNSQRTKHIDTRRHFVREWVEDDILKIVFTPSLENTADISSKNPTEEIFQKHAVNLVKTIPKRTEMCIVTTFPSQDIIFEYQQNEWIKVMRKYKMKAKGRDKSPPSNAMVRAIFDSKYQKTNLLKLPTVKPLNRKERKRHQNRRSKLRSIDQMMKSNDQQNNTTVLPDSHELYGYISKQAFNAYLTKESKETMDFSEFFTAKLDRARSIEKMDITLKPGHYMI
jgi:hypothetical protein